MCKHLVRQRHFLVSTDTINFRHHLSTGSVICFFGWLVWCGERLDTHSSMTPIVALTLLALAAISWYSYRPSTTAKSKKKRNRKKKSGTATTTNETDETREIDGGNEDSAVEIGPEAVSSETTTVNQHTVGKPKKRTQWKPLGSQIPSESSSDQSEGEVEGESVKQRVAPEKITPSTKFMPEAEATKFKVHRVLRLKDDPVPEKMPLHAERDGFRNVIRAVTKQSATQDTLTRTQKKNQKKMEAKKAAKEAEAADQEAALRQHRLQQARTGANQIYIPPNPSAWKGKPKKEDDISKVWN